MSSTSHNSYLRGSTLGGPSDGLDRLGELRLDVTTDDVLVELVTVVYTWVSSCEFLLLAGDTGLFAAVLACLTSSALLIGSIFGSGGASGIADWGFATALVVVAAVCAAPDPDAAASPEAWRVAPWSITVGSKGSMGEYCVAASTPTYCFGRACDVDLFGPTKEPDGECSMVCFDCRRGRAAVTLGE